jgi:hypothetical protein
MFFLRRPMMEFRKIEFFQKEFSGVEKTVKMGVKQYASVPEALVDVGIYYVEIDDPVEGAANFLGFLATKRDHLPDVVCYVDEVRPGIHFLRVCLRNLAVEAEFSKGTLGSQIAIRDTVPNPLRRHFVRSFLCSDEYGGGTITLNGAYSLVDVLTRHYPDCVDVDYDETKEALVIRVFQGTDIEDYLEKLPQLTEAAWRADIELGRPMRYAKLREFHSKRTAELMNAAGQTFRPVLSVREMRERAEQAAPRHSVLHQELQDAYLRAGGSTGVSGTD